MVKHYTYDGLGRLVCSHSPFPNAGQRLGPCDASRLADGGVESVGVAAWRESDASTFPTDLFRRRFTTAAVSSMDSGERGTRTVWLPQSAPWSMGSARVSIGLGI